MIIKQYKCPRCNGEYFFNAEEEYSEICPKCGIELRLWKINDNGFISVVDASMNTNADPIRNEGWIGSSGNDNFQQRQRITDKESKVLRILELIGSILCLAGIFLPFVKVSIFGSVIERSFSNLAPIDHLLFIGIAVAGIIGAALRRHLLTAIMGIAYGGLLFFETKDYFADINESEYGSMVTKGGGFYFMVIGLLLMVGSGLYALYLRKKQETIICPSCGHKAVANEVNCPVCGCQISGGIQYKSNDLSFENGASSEEKIINGNKPLKYSMIALGIIIPIIVIINLLGGKESEASYSSGKSTSSSYSNNTKSNEKNNDTKLPTEEINKNIPLGTAYEVAQGEYECGVDIPAGRYLIEWVSGNPFGGSISASGCKYMDSYVSVDSSNPYTCILEEGDKFEVSLSTVKFTKITSLPNKNYLQSDGSYVFGAGYYFEGIDIPKGTYNVTAVGGNPFGIRVSTKTKSFLSLNQGETYNNLRLETTGAAIDISLGYARFDPK